LKVSTTAGVGSVISVAVAVGEITSDAVGVTTAVGVADIELTQATSSGVSNAAH
jgi:hypothetical protein